MIFITVQLHAVYNLAHLAVHADIQITFLAPLLEKLFVMSLTGTYQRGDVYKRQEYENTCNSSSQKTHLPLHAVPRYICIVRLE